VLAIGRPEKYSKVLGQNYATASWFRQAMTTRDGTEFAVADIAVEPAFGRSVATYSTAIRQGGQVNGAVTGVLAVWFDWQSQAEKVVTGVHLSEHEKGRSRCLILDSSHRVIAASDGKGLLSEVFRLPANAKDLGYYLNDTASLVGYALTPGYETYQGLGWYGVVVQSDLPVSGGNPSG